MENQGNMPNSQQGMMNQQASSQSMSYQQFQEQVQRQQEQERIMAQQALRNAGLDGRSQQVRQMVIELQNIGRELQVAENQLQMQMDAQKRQIQNIQKRLQQFEQQVQSSLSASGGSQPANNSPFQ